MGEAKRRKKVLGEDYGKIPPTLIPGSKIYKKHLEKFHSALEKKTAGINFLEEEVIEACSQGETADSDILERLDSEELKAKGIEIKKWLVTYLAPYQTKDREKLVVGILHPLYEQVGEMEHGNNPKLLQQFAMSWSLEAANYFSWFKDYLGEEVAKFYAEPLTSFYEILVEEGIAENSEKPVAKLLKSIFSDALEIQL